MAAREKVFSAALTILLLHVVLLNIVQTHCVHDGKATAAVRQQNSTTADGSARHQ
jgi:hypothetical protein